VEDLRKYKIVTAIGGILIALGLIGVLWGIQPTSGTETLTIPTGEGYYSYMKVSGWWNGHLSGDFTLTSSGAVDFHVLDESQFEEFSNDFSHSGTLESITDTSGEFSVDLPSTGTYYLTINHGSGYDLTAQEVTINYKVTGLDLIFLIGGIVLLVIGAVLTLVGLRMKAKETVAPAPARPPPTDVTLFDNKPNPPS
jgi:hypothetical protein